MGRGHRNGSDVLPKHADVETHGTQNRKVVLKFVPPVKKTWYVEFLLFYEFKYHNVRPQLVLFTIIYNYVLSYEALILLTAYTIHV